MRIPRTFVMATLVITVLFPLGCGKKSGDKAAAAKEFTVKEVGVKVTAPGDWEVEQRGNRWVVKSGVQGVFLEKRTGSMPGTPEEAAKQFAKTQVLASEKLPGGGIYLFYQMDFAGPADKTPKWLKYVYAITPVKDGGTATCTVQLLEDADQKTYEPLCKSLRPL